jgi:copper(I)-binding protein
VKRFMPTKPYVTWSLFLFALLLLAACGAAPTPETGQAGVMSGSSADGALVIQDAVINATPINGALYFTVQNNGKLPDTLMAADTTVAGEVELHESSMDGNMMQMRPVSGVDVPAGEAVTLEPGGLHVMLIDLRQSLEVHDMVDVTLTFEKAGPVTVVARVARGSDVAQNPDETTGNHDHEAHHGDETDAHDPMDEHDHGAVAQLAAADLADGQKLKVVATTNIVGDIVKQVGGDMIDLTVLLPPGTDPHTFEPSPRDLATVAEAHVVFANGMGLEAFLQDMIENAGGEAVIVHVSDGIELRQFGAGHAHEHGGHEGTDPHTWTSPVNVLVFVHNIDHALGALDPTHSDDYGKNSAAYEAELEELDSWVTTKIESVPPGNRKFVTDHTVFGYYADRYGLEQVWGRLFPRSAPMLNQRRRSWQNWQTL